MARKSKGQTNGKQLDEDGFEIIGGDSTPLQVGEMVEGLYGGVVRSLKGKKGNVPVIQIGTRTILGNVVLMSRIKDGKVNEGDTLRVTRLEDAAKKPGRNPAKMFAVAVKRA